MKASLGGCEGMNEQPVIWQNKLAQVRKLRASDQGRESIGEVVNPDSYANPGQLQLEQHGRPQYYGAECHKRRSEYIFNLKVNKHYRKTISTETWRSCKDREDKRPRIGQGEKIFDLLFQLSSCFSSLGIARVQSAISGSLARNRHVWIFMCLSLLHCFVVLELIEFSKKCTITNQFLEITCTE